MPPYIGYALREQNRYVLTDPAINAVELTFERADDPLRVERYLGELEPAYVSVHALKLSPGSPELPSREYLETLKSIADENDACSVSDHLGFTRDSQTGVEMGHFAPLPMTVQALDATSRNLEVIQQFFAPRHFFLENIAYLFRLDGEMNEAAFLCQLLQRTGCGWLLDVTNVYANATNFDFDPFEFISEVMPSAERVQMHLAGGYFEDEIRMYVDSHSHPIPEGVWKLYRHALQQAGRKVDAVFVERDQNFPDENGWRKEIREVRRIAEEIDQQHAMGKCLDVFTGEASVRNLS